MSEQPVTNTTQSNLHIETTDLLYLLDLVKGEVKAEINCHAIGTIQTFDPSSMTCSVQLNYQKTLRKRNASSAAPNTYTDVIIPYPVLIRVPIIVLGGGGSSLTFPIAAGDNCLVLFCDRDIDGWLESGQTTNPPFTGRMHDLSDAVVIVGLYPAQSPIANYNTQEITMQDATGNRLCQSGMMMAYGGATAPSGWLLCDGSSYAQSKYPLLFAAIGTVYGGSGSNFQVPNMKGQVAVGLKSGDPNFGALGNEYGEETYTLTVTDLPPSVLNNLSTTPAFVEQDGNTRDISLCGQPIQTPISLVQPSLVVNWIIKI